VVIKKKKKGMVHCEQKTTLHLTLTALSCMAQIDREGRLTPRLTPKKLRYNAPAIPNAFNIFTSKSQNNPLPE
jgi:hypothetical protein